MNLDIEKYCKHRVRYNLDKDREEEIIRYLSMIMDEFVSAAFNKHPIQHVLQERSCKTLQSQGSVIDSKDRQSSRSTKTPHLDKMDRRILS